MKGKFLISLALLSVLVLTHEAAAQDNWTHFRGSRLDGIAPSTRVAQDWNNAVK